MRVDVLDSKIILNIKKGKIKEVSAVFSQNDANISEPSSGDTALHIAIAYHRDKIIKQLMKNKSLNINLQNNEKQSPLHYTILHRNFFALKELSKRATELEFNLCDKNGNNILHYAALKSFNISEIKKILSSLRKTNFNVFDCLTEKNNLGNTPLHLATEHASFDLIQFGVQLDTQILEIQNNENQIPFDMALKAGKTEVVTLLLPLTPTEKIPKTLLDIIVNMNMVKLLEQLFTIKKIKNRINLNELDKNTEIPFYVSSAFPGLSQGSLSSLYTKVKEYNKPNEEGHTCLHQTIMSKKINLLSIFLLQTDVDLSIQNKKGNTPFHLAFLKDYFDTRIIHLLLQWLQIRKAAKEKNRSAVTKKYLEEELPPLWSIIKSSVLNCRNYKGFTPLCLVFNSHISEKLQIELTDRLLELGADPTLFTTEGCTPLHFAVNERNTKAIESLRLAGSAANVVNNSGISPLEEALNLEDTELIRALTVDIEIIKKKRLPKHGSKCIIK